MLILLCSPQLKALVIEFQSNKIFLKKEAINESERLSLKVTLKLPKKNLFKT